MTSPLIGVTTSARFSPSWPLLALAVAIVGGRPRRITPRTPTLDYHQIDGLVIGGGDDLGAELYGAKAVLNTRVDPERDELELGLLERCWSTDVPILGVCRGAQVMNVFRGGSLHVDLHAVYQAAPKMRTILPKKLVFIGEDSTLGRVAGADTLTVNSLHHQSVDRLGAGLRVSARDEHGVVQGLETPGAPFRIGVQWHPEFLIYRRPHRSLFKKLVGAASQRRATSNKHWSESLCES